MAQGAPLFAARSIRGRPTTERRPRRKPCPWEAPGSFPRGRAGIAVPPTVLCCGVIKPILDS